MRVTRIVAFAVIAASVGVGGLHAQNLRNAEAPAEFPPASYKGAQYIDSKGCVYIRAGIDGNVTWVPRVNRQRKLICGQTPSLSTQAAQAARSAPQQSARQQVEQITIAPSAQPAPQAAPRTATAAPAPKPAPKTTTRTTTTATAQAERVRPAPTRRVVTVAPPTPKPVIVTPKPAPVAKAAPAPTPRRIARVQTQPAAKATHTPACSGVSPISGRYINSGAKAPVRCGPQVVTRNATRPVATAPVVATQAPRAVPVRRSVAVSTPNTVSPQTRVVPRHVYEGRLADDVYQVPNGYRPVWEDDRLNRRRAEQNLEGIARTRLRWTTTVPRRLIDRTTGRDVTTTVPLVYPYTDATTQQRELGTVTLVRRDGKLMKRIVRNKARTKVAKAPAVQQAARATPKAKATQAPAAATTAGRYVQVGTYGVPANAQSAAKRIARAGLPARIGRFKRGGKTYQVVLAGPFTSSSSLNKGLSASRAAGFGDAFVRK